MPPRPVRWARTNAAGSYTIFGLAPGTYVVAAQKRGYLAASLSVDVAAGATTSCDIQLAPNDAGPRGAIAGVVTTLSESGAAEPVAGALVTVEPPAAMPTEPQALPRNLRKMGAHMPPEPAYYAYTDETGAYRIDGIPAGAYAASAVRPGFRPASASVQIRADETTTQDFTLTANQLLVGTIEGEVHDAASNQPIVGAIVGLRMDCVAGSPGDGSSTQAGGSGSLDPSPAVLFPDVTMVLAETDASGRFRLRAPAGTVELFAQANGFELHTETVEVSAGATTTVSIGLTAVSGQKVTLAGVVVTRGSDGSLRPVADAQVVAGRLDDPAMGVAGPMPRPDLGYRTATGPDGSFRLTVIAGMYWISAWSGDLGCAPVSVDATADARVTIEVGPVWPMMQGRVGR
jgi:hypothetical protein